MVKAAATAKAATRKVLAAAEAMHAAICQPVA